MPYSVHQSAPFFTEPSPAGTTVLLETTFGAAKKPSRLINSWQEAWYTELPATFEGRSAQTAADQASFRSIYQERYTDERGRKQHAAEDEKAAASGVVERIEDVREPVRMAEMGGGNGPTRTLNEQGGANRGRVFMMKEDGHKPRKALLDKANEQHQARKPGQGWSYIANNGEGSAGPKGRSSESRGAKDLNGSALGSRGTISHVGDHIESDVGVSRRKDFGWGFVSNTGEGARPDGPREGIQAQALRKTAL